MDKVKVIVSFKIKNEDMDFAIEYLKEFVRQTQKSSGCISADFLKDNANENQFYFIEEWKDKNALTTHVQSDYFKEYAPFFAFHFEELTVRQMTSLIEKTPD